MQQCCVLANMFIPSAKNNHMTFKTYKKLLPGAAGIFMLLLTFSSCKKDAAVVPEEISLSLPSTLSVVYGEVTDLPLPAELTGQADLTFKIEFSETENIQIGSGVKLYDKLARAVTVDKQQGKIHIDSRLVYPNGAVSSINGNTLPESYKVTVVASSSQGTITGRQTMALRVNPAQARIKDLKETGGIPFAYVLYSDKGAVFELEAPAISTEGTTWYLPAVADANSVVAITGAQIRFSANAGDTKKQAEQTYNLEPALQKDGFTVAATKLRVVFIPQIKFFYGTYYPEYDLTLIFNLLHIALSNGYLSAKPVLYPERYKSTFRISSIAKDGVAYDNSQGIFEIESTTGAVRVKQNSSLTAGQYKLIITALTTTGLEFTTDLTLAMEGE